MRLVLHSPSRSTTLEIMAFDKEANEVTVLSWQTGHVYKMPYDPEAWKAGGWVREKLDEAYDEPIEDARMVGYTAPTSGD